MYFFPHQSSHFCFSWVFVIFKISFFFSSLFRIALSHYDWNFTLFFPPISSSDFPMRKKIINISGQSSESYAQKIRVFIFSRARESNDSFAQRKCRRATDPDRQKSVEPQRSKFFVYFSECKINRSASNGFSDVRVLNQHCRNIIILLQIAVR